TLAVASSSTRSGMSITSPPKRSALPPAGLTRPHSRLPSDIALRLEIRVEHLARDGRGSARAAAAVLDNDRERDPGILSRRERDEQAVVAQTFLDVRLSVLLVLTDREHLRRAGLARDLVLRALHRRVRRAPRIGRDADHRVVHERPLLVRRADDGGARHGLRPGHLARHAVLGADQQARREPFAARGHAGARARELQGRDEHVALADARVDRVAREPDLVLAALELLPLPLDRRNDAALLAVDV